MMMGMHTAVAASLMSLTLGTFLLLWTCKAEVCCKMFGKIIGIIVIVLSILSIICSGYHGVRMMSMKGGFGKMPCMQDKCGEEGCMDGMGHRGMKRDCPMMKMMMEKEMNKEQHEGHDNN